MTIDCPQRIAEVEHKMEEAGHRAELTLIEARRQIARAEDLLEQIEAMRVTRQSRRAALVDEGYRAKLWEKWSSRWLTGASKLAPPNRGDARGD
jgi:hypothetical protein